MTDDILATVEKKHPQDFNKELKIAVIYAKKEQFHPMQMFKNRNFTNYSVFAEKSDQSKKFQDFLNILGTEIDLAEWKGYKGDMGSSGMTLQTSWNEWTGIYTFDDSLKVIYHISTWLNSEQHRRLIGNDINVKQSPSLTVRSLYIMTTKKLHLMVRPSTNSELFLKHSLLFVLLSVQENGELDA
jgi:hypothetical protein